MGEAYCFGRRGATEIRITDDDRKFFFIPLSEEGQIDSLLIAMIIGFTQRSQTVSESMALPGSVFPLSIDVATLRTAEREHPMIFRVLDANSLAIVEPIIGAVVDPLYDARFGSRDNNGDGNRIEVVFVLKAFDDAVPSMITLIKNDLRPENEECFTIHIFPVDVSGRRKLFFCHHDSGADNYFCLTEICIEDDDGRYVTNEVSTAEGKQ